MILTDTEMDMSVAAAKLMDWKVYKCEGDYVVVRPDAGFTGTKMWSPLLVDQDAFALMAKLRMAVHIEETHVTVYVPGVAGCTAVVTYSTEQHIRGALRRAILVVAANFAASSK